MATPSDIAHLVEGCELECKLAGGADGWGELPRSFFDTYSAMANTGGGVVLLGVKEKPRDRFTVDGVAEHGRVQTDLWNQLNNPGKVSVNLLTDAHVQVVQLDGKPVIRVRIPRALRRQRPVYLNGNPLTGTWRRNHEGDYHCDAETVRRMLAEQVEDVRDARVLHGFGLDDLDRTSLAAYRNQLRSAKPSHPFLSSDDRGLLEQLGGWGRDRETGHGGVTLAGVLMFGRFRPIHEAVQNYVVDYQEWAAGSSGAERWADRVTTDGTWSGNLFDFYRIVYPKLTAELKVPFRLQGNTRVDETPIHEALREAFVNTLIHADYTGRVAVLIVKRPDLFGFCNPGAMRLPLEQAMRGGLSDCRNRNLQKMFQLAGWGEQAGSGIPRINRNWGQANWRPPDLWEQTEPDQTLMTLRPVSLLPAEAVADLERRYGGRLAELTQAQRLVLGTVAVEGLASHARMKSITGLHSADLTKQLGELVEGGFLDSDGYSHGTKYFFPGEAPEPTGAALVLDAARAFGGDLFSHLRPPPSGPVPNAPYPVPNATEVRRLEAIAEPIRSAERASPDAVRGCILRLCAVRPLSRQELAHLLDRNPDQLRINYLTPLVRERLLTLLYPDNKSHPSQKYTASPSPDGPQDKH